LSTSGGRGGSDRQATPGMSMWRRGLRYGLGKEVARGVGGTGRLVLGAWGWCAGPPVRK
jgi:hypothetical protein